MQNVSIELVIPQTLQAYINTGIASYTQHYLHLWENRNPRQYMENNFSLTTLDQEIFDANLAHYIISYSGISVGIIKLIKNKSLETYSAQETIFLEKIYFLKSHTRKGLGQVSLRFIEQISRELGKNILWLNSMQKRGANEFYLQNGFEIYGEKLLEYNEVKEREKPMFILKKHL